MGWEKKQEKWKNSYAGLTGWYLNQKVLDHVAVNKFFIFFFPFLVFLLLRPVCLCMWESESILKSPPRFLWHTLWVPASPFSTSFSGEHSGLGRFRRVCTTQSLAKRFFLVTGLQNDFPFESRYSLCTFWWSGVYHILFLLLSQTVVVDLDNTWLVCAC